MKVLIACEFSGVVREAFKRKGHDVWSCDSLDTEIPGQHIKGNVLEILNDGWNLMIAHPPCTYLSNAGARFLYPKGILNQNRYKKGLEAKKLFMEIYNSPIEKICIENPIPSKIFNLPEKSQSIQPYYFGDPYSKRTYLWLKNLPLLKSTKIVDYETTKVPGNWYNKGGKDRQKNRSRTFQGIADAMAEQWG